MFIRERDPSCDIFVGLEGSVVEVADRHIDVGVVCVIGISGVRGIAMSQGLALWPEVANQLESGRELSVVLDELYNADTIKTRDCSGFMTNGQLPSKLYYQQPAVLALQDYLRQSNQAAI